MRFYLFAIFVAALALSGCQDMQNASVLSRTCDASAQWTEIDSRELVSYASEHVGEHVQIQGKVFNLKSQENYFQIWAERPTASRSGGAGAGAGLGGGLATDAVVVTYTSLPTRVYEGDHVQVYGCVAGTVSGKNVMGADSSWPVIIARGIVHK